MSDSKSENFEQVLSRLLKPIARAMIFSGVTLSAANEALKRALYDAAAERIEPEKKITDSRISLLTGLHRKDVRRLKEDPTPRFKNSLVNASTLATGVWKSNAQFCDANGLPLPLLRFATSTERGFDELVRAARIDLPDATVLDALLREKIADWNENGDRIQLTQDAFVATSNSKALLHAYEKNLVAHHEVATDNLVRQDDSNAHFERATHVNQLSQKSLDTLEAEARRLAQAALEDLNTKALALQDEDLKRQNQDGGAPTELGGHFSFGSYVLTHMRQPNEDKQEADSDDA